MIPGSILKVSTISLKWHERSQGTKIHATRLKPLNLAVSRWIRCFAILNTIRLCFAFICEDTGGNALNLRSTSAHRASGLSMGFSEFWVIQGKPIDTIK